MTEHTALDDEIEELERRLDVAKARRHDLPPQTDERVAGISQKGRNGAAFHNLLVLSDSALPLGSFAFSSGLESYMAHVSRSSRQKPFETFKSFLNMSTASIASTTLPYVTNAYLGPKQLSRLDNDFDASTSCTVARRASIAQGRALLAMWDRSLRLQVSLKHADRVHAKEALQEFSDLIKNLDARDVDTIEDFDCSPRGHLAPLFGVLSNVMGLDLRDSVYLYLLSHCKTLLSAGIRASLFGPYQSQGLLTSQWLRSLISSYVEADMAHPRSTDDAGQSVPVLDIWGGRHEILYSRIFNS